MVPRLCLSSFLLGSETLSPPGSSRSLLLLPGLSLQTRDSSPPDKPAAPAGGAELRSTGNEGLSWEERGGLGRRWEKEGEQQSVGKRSSHSCPAG